MKTKLLDIYISQHILKAIPRKCNIPGAPFIIGDKVMVLNNPNNDETFNNDFSNKQGIVEHFEYDCGCGQSFPDDPMIGVRFDDKRIEDFWKDELQLL